MIPIDSLSDWNTGNKNGNATKPFLYSMYGSSGLSSICVCVEVYMTESNRASKRERERKRELYVEAEVESRIELNILFPDLYKVS